MLIGGRRVGRAGRVPRRCATARQIPLDPVVLQRLVRNALEDVCPPRHPNAGVSRRSLQNALLGQLFARSAGSREVPARAPVGRREQPRSRTGRQSGGSVHTCCCGEGHPQAVVEATPADRIEGTLTAILGSRSPAETRDPIRCGGECGGEVVVGAGSAVDRSGCRAPWRGCGRCCTPRSWHWSTSRWPTETGRRGV